MEIKDLPQLEEATESDHVVSSISQKTRLISFKNIFEKISFSSLVTTAKNIIGSINELKGRCDTLDTSVSELNTDKIGFMYVDETLTCQAGTIREYAFSNLPTHRISIPIVINASNSIVGVEVFRNSEVNGGVKVYSPVAQNVIVRLLVFI